MDFPTAVRTCFSKFATFSGRASRSEYWYIQLFLFIVFVLAGIIDYLVFNGTPILDYIFTFGSILPYLAVTVRRLHDLDKSGWWWLIGFIPLVGAIILLVWFCQRGTVGPNRFGPDPLLTSALPPAQPQAIIGR